METTGSLDSVHQIDLTEDQVVEANLRELGVPTDSIGPSLEERAVEELKRLIQKHKRLVSTREVAEALGVSPNAALSALNRAVSRGVVFRRINARTSRACFVPKVL